ncbi:hypothetical protein, partial [Chromobacterium phragmitis]|uniref:hypothetical protein n=1 Tax=Chromobacterium phragmitis TaxID=2202141 RepID=UPI0032673F65
MSEEGLETPGLGQENPAHAIEKIPWIWLCALCKSLILLKSVPTVSVFNPRFHFLFHGIANFSTMQFPVFLGFLSFF